MKSTRYYLMDNLNGQSLMDCLGSDVIEIDFVNYGSKNRESLLEGQSARCKELNRIDFLSRRQFGESRQAFAARLEA